MKRATVLQPAGLSTAAFPGPSLFSDSDVPVLAQVGFRPQVPASWPTSRGWVKSLTTRRWHFILLESGQVELYDLAVDPEEATNLAARPELAETVEELRTLVERRAPADFRP